ncbi:uncharacterized protein LOC131213175 [Anopheles bellator]|uniref:uncharacterized protein LOC131213175 n=1 Tax=Anopheles bellator TaxID=139047 RepID=UPI002648F342|nr:uncharacterized protein LOC131213175 [Anopheles bellator]
MDDSIEPLDNDAERQMSWFLDGTIVRNVFDSSGGDICVRELCEWHESPKRLRDVPLFEDSVAADDIDTSDILATIAPNVAAQCDVIESETCKAENAEMDYLNHSSYSDSTLDDLQSAVQPISCFGASIVREQTSTPFSEVIPMAESMANNLVEYLQEIGNRFPPSARPDHLPQQPGSLEINAPLASEKLTQRGTKRRLLEKDLSSLILVHTRENRARFESVPYSVSKNDCSKVSSPLTNVRHNARGTRVSNKFVPDSKKHFKVDASGQLQKRKQAGLKKKHSALRIVHTRCGRMSRPPRSTNNNLGHADINPVDEPMPTLTFVDNDNTQAPSHRVDKRHSPNIPLEFKCGTCQKTYLGARMKTHLSKFPTHVALSEMMAPKNVSPPDPERTVQHNESLPKATKTAETPSRLFHHLMQFLATVPEYNRCEWMIQELSVFVAQLREHIALLIAADDNAENLVDAFIDQNVADILRLSSGTYRFRVDNLISDLQGPALRSEEPWATPCSDLLCNFETPRNGEFDRSLSFVEEFFAMLPIEDRAAFPNICPPDDTSEVYPTSNLY